MFTGIVEEMGTLKAIRKGPHSAVLEIQAKVVLEDIHLGDSIAVNGVCLTATSYSPHRLHRRRHARDLEPLRPGHPPPGQPGQPGAGHGGKRPLRRPHRGHHVDGVGTVQQITRDDNAIWYTIAAGPEILRYVVEKGSITIDGISLTVAKVDRQSFAISAIPTPCRHRAGRPEGGRPCQPRNGHHRKVRGKTPLPPQESPRPPPVSPKNF